MTSAPPGGSAPPLAPALISALDRVTAVPRLLVASDYDGVLAPIVADPARAWPLPEAVTALAGLAELPDTAVAVVSGRARGDLAALAGLPEAVTLVGSHGGEFADGFVTPLGPDQLALHDRLQRRLREIVAGAPGVALEVKPASVVLHTRNAPRPVAAEVTAAASEDPATWPGVHVTAGKEVVEMAVLSVTKGTAVTTLRERGRADAVVFLGDDVTDETVFAVLGEPDVGVKVGPGETAARHRVASPSAAARVLWEVRRRRAGRAAAPA